MQPPAFWHNPPHRTGLVAQSLRPLGSLYAAATARRVRRLGARLDIPVICVGNVNAGGTGKTPTTIALVQRLMARGIAAHIVTRGYRGRLLGPVQVDPARHTADDVGDEALLLAAFAPTWLAKNRAEGGRAAQESGAHVIVLDDGFQNPSLHKDMSIVTVDAVKGFGNGLCLPAGPLRETVQAGLARADFLLSIGEDGAQTRFSQYWEKQITAQHVRAMLTPLNTGIDWSHQRVFAFAGIGHPDKFFATLRGLGAEVVGTVSLADHQTLSPALMQRLERDAAQKNAQLVTTEKDQIRLPARQRGSVLTLPVRLEVQGWASIDAALERLGLSSNT